MTRGLFYQLGPASPGAFEALRNEVALAESLGLDAVWCLPRTDDAGGWQGSAPGIWLAALAGATGRIRLGWGVPGIWPPRAAPLREAEQGASLDVASGGRIELAVLPDPGAAADPTNPPEDEGVRMWVDMWAPATFSWTSPRFSVPPVDVVPKPVQRPHPPLWLVGWTADHAEAAGRGGLGFLDVSGGDEPVWEAHRACYVGARAEADPEALVCAEAYAVAIDPAEGSERALAARRGAGGPCARDWLEALAARGIEHVLLRAGPLDGGHDEACRRIRWFAQT